MNIRQRLLAAGLSLLATGILLPVPGAARLPERARTEGPGSANGATDAVLCYGGSHHRTPYLWDEERLTPYVTCTDSAGIERWLFDGFIFLEFQDTNRPDGRLYTYETGHLRDMGFAAGKEQWQELIDYWFAEGNGVNALEEVVARAAERIGKAPTRRKVIMVLPDPVIHRHYIDTTSTTRYWGEINGREMDFSRTEDRLEACKWFIDRVRERFEAGGYRHIELEGFYWLREIVTRPRDTAYSYHLTRSDILLPRIADYLHAQGYSFSWIPYYGSRGYDDWRLFGFDQVYLQPNHYWKPANAWEDVCAEIARYGVGMELEFELTLLRERSGSEAFRARFREYMDAARRCGIYGSKPFTYYHGTNGFHDLWASDDEEDRALFRELCAFILGNPLRAAQTPEEKKNNKPNTKQQPNL